jgi:hypothetical protein
VSDVIGFDVVPFALHRRADINHQPRPRMTPVRAYDYHPPTL